MKPSSQLPPGRIMLRTCASSSPYDALHFVLPNNFMQPDVPLHAVAELAQQAQEDASTTDEDAEVHARSEEEADAGSAGHSSSAAPAAASPRVASAGLGVSTCGVI